MMDRALARQAADVLDRAAAIIATPSNWSQGVTATDRNGRELLRWDVPNATCFCVGAAIDKAAFELFGESPTKRGPVSAAAEKFFSGIHDPETVDEPGMWIVRFNDNPATTHEEVLARLVRAAAEARAL